jgi:hypothetical protein
MFSAMVATSQPTHKALLLVDIVLVIESRSNGRTQDSVNHNNFSPGMNLGYGTTASLADDDVLNHGQFVMACWNLLLGVRALVGSEERTLGVDNKVPDF